MINGLVVSCMTYFVVYATVELNMTLGQWATAMAVRYLTIALPAIIAGFSMDVLGRKRFLILGYLLYIRLEICGALQRVACSSSCL